MFIKCIEIIPGTINSMFNSCSASVLLICLNYKLCKSSFSNYQMTEQLYNCSPAYQLIAYFNKYKS